MPGGQTPLDVVNDPSKDLSYGPGKTDWNYVADRYLE